MNTMQERGAALREHAINMLWAAEKLNRTAVRWSVSPAAELDLRGSRDIDGQFGYSLTHTEPTLHGLPVEVDPKCSAIVLVLENGDRITEMHALKDAG